MLSGEKYAGALLAPHELVLVLGMEDRRVPRPHTGLGDAVWPRAVGGASCPLVGVLWAIQFGPGSWWFGGARARFIREGPALVQMHRRTEDHIRSTGGVVLAGCSSPTVILEAVFKTGGFSVRPQHSACRSSRAVHGRRHGGCHHVHPQAARLVK